MKRREFCLAGAAAFVAVQSPVAATAAQLVAPSSAPKSGADTPDDPLAGPSQGPWRRLFLDGAVVEKSQGLSRVFHAAIKHGDPLIQRDRPWEGVAAITGPYVYGTVLWDGGKLRMWYQVLTRGNYGADAARLWGVLRTGINDLARAYNIPPLGI